MKNLVLALATPSALFLAGCASGNIRAVDTAPIQVNVSDYASLDAAIAACRPDRACQLTVPAGTFATSLYGANCIARSNLTIIGAGQAAYDNLASPIKLKTGTVIQPGITFCGASNILVSDLGIDDGPAYVAGGGPVTDGLVFTGPATGLPSDPLWTNNTALRITSLGSSPSAAVHAFRFEHGYGLTFDGLKATYDTHCLAIKSQNVTGGSFYGQACNSDQVVIKSDDYTAVSQVAIKQITLGSLKPNDSQNGVVIDSEAQAGTNNTSEVHIGNIQATGIYSAVTLLANGNVQGDAVSSVTIDSLQVKATNLGGAVPDCLLSSSSSGQTFRAITISDAICANATGSGGFTSTRIYAPLLDSTLNNWTVTGLVNPGTISGPLTISGWSNDSPGIAIPSFYLVGGPSTVVQMHGFTNAVAGASPYATDGQGENMQVSP